ncbi:hypothetical protein [Neobacillus sp. 114]|uniref:hypothetical protein n=1 Tax=Neobacillus sp. 114 TaxID=3048535 RepID=UPI0024C23888|nr:hypothetical protein [Neobacillus sp. 114]
MKEIENPMVIDSLWRHREKEPQVFGECAGCKEDIIAGDDYYEFVSVEIAEGQAHRETILVHQSPECCQQYVGEMSFCRTAGEK